MTDIRKYIKVVENEVIDKPPEVKTPKIDPETKKPKMWRVVLHNDDYTPAFFVVKVLQTVFNLNGDQAYRLMMVVHRQGAGTCGVYTHEVAEQKQTEAMDMAKQEDHGLLFTIEEAE